MPARQYVRFHLRDRDDCYLSKAPGFIMRMDRLLESIEVGWNDPDESDDKVLCQYDMVYEISDDSNRPLLKTVDSTCKSRSPQFMYHSSGHYFVWQLLNNVNYSDPEINPEATRYFEGDFNGDGISDMVFFNSETGNWKAVQGIPGGGYCFRVYGNRFKGYNNESRIQWFRGNLSGDYNGDGRSDIAFYLPETREF